MGRCSCRYWVDVIDVKHTSSGSGISVTACSGSRHRAAVMRAIPHYVGLLPMPVNASHWSELRSSICNPQYRFAIHDSATALRVAVGPERR